MIIEKNESKLSEDNDILLFHVVAIYYISYVMEQKGGFRGKMGTKKDLIKLRNRYNNIVVRFYFPFNHIIYTILDKYFWSNTDVSVFLCMYCMYVYIKCWTKQDMYDKLLYMYLKIFNQITPTRWVHFTSSESNFFQWFDRKLLPRSVYIHILENSPAMFLGRKHWWQAFNCEYKRQSNY